MANTGHMPGRLEPLVNGEIYHVFNLGIDHRPTFTDHKEYSRAQDILQYYQYSTVPVRFSYFLTIDQDEREHIMQGLTKEDKKMVRCLCFCFMPNHFHFLIQQTIDGGISKFMSKYQNSYTRYYNTRNSRTGPLFLDQFKAVRIENEPQLMHVSRYIHLNPYTAYLVKSLEALETYYWSSLPEYLSSEPAKVAEPQAILSLFKNRDTYKQFIFDQADYQRELGKIKHLVMEK